MLWAKRVMQISLELFLNLLYKSHFLSISTARITNMTQTLTQVFTVTSPGERQIVRSLNAQKDQLHTRRWVHFPTHLRICFGPGWSNLGWIFTLEITLLTSQRGLSSYDDNSPGISCGANSSHLRRGKSSTIEESILIVWLFVQNNLYATKYLSVEGREKGQDGSKNHHNLSPMS